MTNIIGALVYTSAVFFAAFAYFGFQIYQAFSFGSIMDDFKQFDLSSCSFIPELEGCKGLGIHVASGFAIAVCHDSILNEKHSGQHSSRDTSASSSLAYFYSYDLKTQAVTKLEMLGFPSDTKTDIFKVDILEDPSVSSLLHLFAVSHKGNENVVEHFIHLLGTSSLKYYETFQSDELMLVNSIAAVSPSSFYYTQGVSHHAGIWNFLESASIVAGGKVMFRDESGNYSEVARGLKYANGIALSSGRKLLYVAERGGAKLHVYERDESLIELEPKEVVPLKFIPNNLHVDSASGHIYVTGFPLQLRALMNFGSSDGTTETGKSASISAKVSNETGEDRFFGRNYKLEPVIMDDGSTLFTIISAVSDESRDVLLLTGHFASKGLAHCRIPI